MFLSTMMHESGDSTAVLFNKDYSGASGVYAIFQPPEDEVWGIIQLTGTIGGEEEFESENFGDIVDGLVIGLQFEVADDNGSYLQLGQNPIKNNENLFYMSTNLGEENDIFDTSTHIYTFGVNLDTKGQPIILIGEKNQRIQLYLNDDLSSLTTLRVSGNGFKANNGVRPVGLINARYIAPIHV